MTKRGNVILKVLLLVNPIILLIVYRVGFSFDGLFGQDAYAYFDRARVLSGSDAVLPYFWPDGYPYLGALLGSIMDLSLAMQLVCAISVGITAVLAIKTYEIKRVALAEATQFIIGLIFLALSPLVIKHSVVIMSDALAMLAIAWVIYITSHAFSWLRFSLLVAVVLMAFMVRFPTVALTLPLLVVWLWKNKVNVLTYIGVLIPVGAMVLFWRSFNHSGLYESAASSWSVMNMFSSEFLGDQGHLKYTFPNVVNVLGVFWNPKFGLLGLLLIYSWIKQRRIGRPMMLICVVVYLLFIAGVPVQNDRFLLLVLPVLIVMGLESIQIEGRTMAAGIVLLGIVNLGVGHYLMEHPRSRSQLEKKLSNSLEGVKGDAVYTFDVDVALKIRLPQKRYFNLWEKEYDYIMPADLLLIHESWTSGQWKETNVSKNISQLKQTDMRMIEDLGEGWKLYQ